MVFVYEILIVLMPDNIYKAAYQRVIKKYGNILLALLIIIALICFWLIYKTRQPESIISVFGILFPICIVLYAYSLEKVRRELYSQIAQELGLSYIHNKDGSFIDSFLETHNHTQHIRHVITGMLDGTQFSYYIYSYTVGSGKNKRTYSYSVIMQTLPVSVPHIIIHDNTYTFTFGLPYPYSRSIPSNLRKVTLEGNFSKERDVYVEKEHEIEAYQLLSPDTMSFLLDNIQDVQIELTKDRLFIYKTHELYRKSDVMEFIDLYKTLTSKIKQVIPSIQKY